MIKTVHVVFKTHLDIGFTDLAENVVDQYVNQYIPKAIKLAKELDSSDEKFIWTTGSWLIHYYLKNATDEQKEEMVQAIKKGYIAWHGLPFTTHTELINKDLLDFGLSMSKNLDKQFSKQTIAAKMTDVPGHSIAMVPLLSNKGVQYLHLGVNPASKTPAVPKLFRWRAACGSEIIVNYAGNYGEIVQMEGLEDALVFAHTGDNCGPPTVEEIKGQFAELAKRFPDAHIKASTMDAFAEKLIDLKEQLPIITEEIGDTWIHGAGTDPYKVAAFRELSRLRSRWIIEGLDVQRDPKLQDFSENLLLVAEHTWGMDLKKYLPDFTNYSKDDFYQARENDIFDASFIPEKYSYIGAFAMDEMDSASKDLFQHKERAFSYNVFESSWKEQRSYIEKAVNRLDNQKKAEAEKALKSLKEGPQNIADGQPLRVGEIYELGRFQVSFDMAGSINFLEDSRGKRWADAEHLLGLYSYETFGTENYSHWFEYYMSNLKQTHPWADSDYGKPGFEYTDPNPKNVIYKPHVVSIKHQPERKADFVQLELQMPNEAVKAYGPPANVVIEYTFPENKEAIDITLYWRKKDANRLPEANWFSFNPVVDNPNRWRIEKIGTSLSPLEVVKDGNRNLHAVDSGVFYKGADGLVKIDTLDAPLVCPGKRKLLQFDNEVAPLDGGMHINLQNNIWGTNFPMWYEDDAKFRFYLEFESY